MYLRLAVIDLVVFHLMASSTTASVGTEACARCNSPTKMRFTCTRHHRNWLCDSCHTARPWCPELPERNGATECGQRGGLTMALRSNSSFSSNESSLLEDSLKKLQEQIDAGCYDADEALSEVERLLVEGRDQHAKGSTTSGDERRDALRRAQKAAEISEKWLNTLPPELQDKTTYAEALLLQANTLAHLAKHEKNDAMFETARRKTEEAVVLLQGLQGVTHTVSRGWSSSTKIASKKRKTSSPSLCRHILQVVQVNFLKQYGVLWHCGICISYSWRRKLDKRQQWLFEASHVTSCRNWREKWGLSKPVQKSIKHADHGPQTKAGSLKRGSPDDRRNFGVDLPGRLCVLGGFTLGHWSPVCWNGNPRKVSLHSGTFRAFDLRMMSSWNQGEPWCRAWAELKPSSTW